MTLTLTCNSKCAALWDSHACQIWSLLSLLVIKLWIFDLWPWRMTLTLTCHVQNIQLQKIHMHNKFKVSISTGSKVMTQTLNLTFDLAEWHWHYNVTTQNMRLHEIHLYTKYQKMSISIGSSYGQNSIFDLWPWKMTLTLWCYHSKRAALWD